MKKTLRINSYRSVYSIDVLAFLYASYGGYNYIYDKRVREQAQIELIGMKVHLKLEIY
jgi:hypothetical protein